MPSSADISRIAKLLAGATSPVKEEADTALNHAYKRMVRDGVTVQDLLTLPESDLYQNALVKLVEVILAHQTDLSPTGYRLAYAEYISRINNKFKPPESEGQGNRQGTGQSDRDEHAQDYWGRNGRGSGASTGTGAGQGSGQSGGNGYGSSGSSSQDQQGSYSSQGSHNPNSSQNTSQSTKNARNAREWASPFQGFKNKLPRSFKEFFSTTWQIVSPTFEQGGFIWRCFHYPTHTARLVLASMLWGMAFALVLMTLAAIGHIATGTSPLIDLPFKWVFTTLTAIGAVWRYVKFARG